MAFRAAFIFNNTSNVVSVAIMGPSTEPEFLLGANTVCPFSISPGFKAAFVAFANGAAFAMRRSRQPQIIKCSRLILPILGRQDRRSRWHPPPSQTTLALTAYRKPSKCQRRGHCCSRSVLVADKEGGPLNHPAVASDAGDRFSSS